MKKWMAFSVSLLLALAFGNPLNAHAVSAAGSGVISEAAGDSESPADDVLADMSDTALDSEDRADFHKQVADDEAFINLVVTAAEHKGKDVFLEGVHPDKCIKLYGFKRSEYLLQSLYDAYTETGKIESLISEDYGVLVLYVNENNEYVDSFVFTRKENLPGAQDKNGWVPLGSGNLTTDEDFLAQYSKEGNLKKYVKGLGLKNTSRLKLTSAIPYMPTCIYFVQQDEEFLIPLEDGRAGIKGCQVYKVSDIAETFLKPILDFQTEIAEEYRKTDSEYLPAGTPRVPEDLPILSAVNLYTYFETDQKISGGDSTTLLTTQEDTLTLDRTAGTAALAKQQADGAVAVKAQETADTTAMAAEQAAEVNAASAQKISAGKDFWAVLAFGIGAATVLLLIGRIVFNIRKKPSDKP